jgi:SAM-dependent methyltransferase
MNKPANKEPRKERDHYPTPFALALACVGRAATLTGEAAPLSGLRARNVLDLGAGNGVWGRAARAIYWSAWLDGYELRPSPKPTHYDGWWTEDVLAADFTTRYGLILANPPYSSAEAFVRLALRLLTPGGRAAFLLPLGFRASQERNKPDGGLWSMAPLRELAVITPRPSFTENGNTDSTDYGLFVFENGYAGPAVLTTLHWSRPSRKKVVQCEDEQYETSLA